ncbi:MAG TPA: FAD-dependent oxidoreductase [Baekduia sp.]|nr:FAD-dependent oxidoreductase [Baekduia sp.]
MSDARHVLEPDELAALAPYGTEEDVLAGSVLFRAGDEAYDFIVVLEGRAAIAEEDGRRRTVGSFGPGEFLGELDLLTGKRAALGSTMEVDGRILRVPAERIRVVMAQEPGLSEMILRTFLARRANLMALGAGLTLIGARADPATRRLLETLSRNQLAASWLELDADPDARDALGLLDVEDADLPVLLVPGAALLRNPTMVELRDALGLARLGEGDRCDLLVVGGGPGGLAAAVYGASEGLSTVLVEGTALGGQAGTSSRIENYLGFPAGLSGAELTTRGVLQAEKFGARIQAGTLATALGEEDGLHAVTLDDGRRVLSRAVIVATGARYRRLTLDGLQALEGVGVYYAATGMEARACAGGPVVVVGGGNSAGQAALYLARACTEVTIVIRRDDLAETMSRYLIDAIEREPRIAVAGGAEVTRLVAEAGVLDAVDLTEAATGAVRTRPACGLFVFIGVAPNTRWLGGQLAQDDRGFLLTGDDIPAADRRPEVPAPLASETSRPGIFCVGDARSGSVKRVATAIGEGAAAVRLAFERFAATGGPESQR